MNKKLLVSSAALLFCFSIGSYAFAADDQTTIELNGTKLQPPAHVDDGNVYLPLRAISEALGYEVQWIESDNAINMLKDDQKINIDLDNYLITENGHSSYMSGSYLGIQSEDYLMINDRTFIRSDILTDTLGLDVKLDEQKNNVTLQNIAQNAITIKTIKQESQTDILKTTLQYPQIDGLNNATVQYALNSFFEKEALKAADEGKQYADELKAYLESEDTGNPNKCETYFDYKIEYNQNGLLSIIFLDYQYTGGAHGMTVQSSHTFDLKTGNEYQLKDLFKSGADYVSFISGKVRTEIDERIKAGLLDEISVFSSIKENQDFYLSNNALMVYFQQYEYFPYVAGIQAFPIDFSTMKDMLKSDFNCLYNMPKSLEPSGVQNTFNVGDTFKVDLKGNPTTGYTWHYTIENSDIAYLYSEGQTRDSSLVGAGSTFTWSYKALKAGQTKITFKYYRDWEGEASATADNTVEYLISVNQ